MSRKKGGRRTGPSPVGVGPGFAARSDIGRVRTTNEDRLLARPPLFAVADGMGGANAGEVAAELAIAHLEGLGVVTSAVAVREAFEAANADVRHRAASDRALQGMGTTCTAALIEASKVHVVHVGDSRAYLIRDGVARQLTTDHSLVASSNVITRAVGVDDRLEVDALTIDVQPGDRVLLCSDGVSGLLADAEIGALVAGDDLEAVVGAIVDRANDAGGVDNASAIVIDPALVEVPIVETSPGEGPLVDSPPGESGPAVQDRRGPTRAWQLLVAALALAVLFMASFVVTTWLARGS